MEKIKNLYSLFVDLYNCGDDQQKFIILVNIINFYYMENINTLTYSTYEQARAIIKVIIFNLDTLYCGFYSNFKDDQQLINLIKEFKKLFKQLDKKYNLNYKIK